MHRETPRGGIEYVALPAPPAPSLHCSVCGGLFRPSGLRLGWVEVGDGLRKPVTYCAPCDPDMAWSRG